MAQDRAHDRAHRRQLGARRRLFARDIERVRKLGIELPIDDFGKGYSSLSYLKQIPATEIKVDKRFVGTVALDETDQQIVKTVIALAHALGMRVVAEGVDSAEALAVVSRARVARWRKASSSAGRCAAISCPSGSTTTRARRPIRARRRHEDLEPPRGT